MKVIRTPSCLKIHPKLLYKNILYYMQNSIMIEGAKFPSIPRNGDYVLRLQAPQISRADSVLLRVFRHLS